MVRRLFIDNQDSTWLTDDSTAYLYEQRCVPLASNSDIVVLSDKPDRAALEYLTRIGIELPEFKVVNERRGDLATSILADRTLLDDLYAETRVGDWIIEPFLWGPSFCELIDFLRIPVNSDFRLFGTFGGKSAFRQLAEQLRLPVPPGVTLSGKVKESEVRRFLHRYQRVIMKEDRSIGSIGITILREVSKEKVDEFLSFAPGETYVLEQLVEPSKEGSVHLVFRGGQYETLVAETFYEGLAYKGCVFPGLREYAKEIETYAEQVASYFLGNYHPRGSYGLDFLIDRNGRLSFLELNPRRTAVTYALEFAQRILGPDSKRCDITERVVRSQKLKDFTLERIVQELRPVLYGYGRKRDGVLLQNIGLASIGAIEAISISTCGESASFLDKVEEILR